ncbi:MAG TPA: UvrB/UvrC motif-containing protein [Clostridiales bacterium]|nr:MAG: UvrB/uvrC motif protein [Firmicutes bacterium ADurb.Bin262]HOU09466.1 UvrB/UvrC motif-containing protein [Clostridiales bacterium]HQH63245.1 UvrB/UvrC motif-containing protein [Clostridiales bacterium]HQK73267.1 UvrB/UvrC motif-containing protein [Clostridiales bacterium]
MMLCQNCGKKEATTHIKSIVNGETAETHLCANCAAHLGYCDIFTGFGFNPGDFFGNLLVNGSRNENESQPLRCAVCSSSFDDIAREGKVGCAQCYETFYDLLLPSLQRIHGKAVHTGKVPLKAGARAQINGRIAQLKEDLQKAVERQDYEQAAKLRDEINAAQKEETP